MVAVNDIAIPTDALGIYSITMSLQPDRNTIDVVATCPGGKVFQESMKESITVTYEEPQSKQEGRHASGLSLSRAGAFQGDAQRRRLSL